MNTFPYDVVEVDGFPERSSGKWESLRSLIIDEMAPQAKENGESTRRLTLPNKREMQNAQSAASNCQYKKERMSSRRLDSERYKIITRSEPVSGTDGEYYLYIQVQYK